MIYQTLSQSLTTVMNDCMVIVTLTYNGCNVSISVNDKNDEIQNSQLIPMQRDTELLYICYTLEIKCNYCHKSTPILMSFGFVKCLFESFNALHISFKRFMGGTKAQSQSIPETYIYNDHICCIAEPQTQRRNDILCTLTSNIARKQQLSMLCRQHCVK